MPTMCAKMLRNCPQNINSITFWDDRFLAMSLEYIIFQGYQPFCGNCLVYAEVTLVCGRLPSCCTQRRPGHTETGKQTEPTVVTGLLKLGWHLSDCRLSPRCTQWRPGYTEIGKQTEPSAVTRLLIVRAPGHTYTGCEKTPLSADSHTNTGLGKWRDFVLLLVAFSNKPSHLLNYAHF